MTRWLSKRWVWAALAGATVTVGMAAGRGDAQPPKVGSVISLNIDGKGDRQFKVIKTEKQPDGTYLSDLQDTKNGETITLVDKPGDPPSGTPGGVPKPPEPPKAKQRTNDPLLPPVKSTLPDPQKEKEKRPILGRIFGDRDKDKTPPAGMPNTTANASPSMDASDSGKRHGLLTRIFGSKKPTGPSMPAATAPAAGPVLRPGSSTPPVVVPTPPGGLTGTTPPAFTPTTPPGGKPLPPFPSTTPEPPRVMSPNKSVAPPTPFVPAPMVPVAPAKPLPPFPSTTPTPVPLPIPTPPPPVAAPKPAPPVATPTPIPSVPTVPALPVPSGGSGFPPIPVPPGGTSMARPIQVIVPTGYVPTAVPQPVPSRGTPMAPPIQVAVPVGYVPAGIAFDREVQPFVIALQSMTAPSARLTAAKGLADGRHRSTDGVKSVLFQAAQMDPCGEVRAACITHLCDLGFFTPHFLGYIDAACNDTDPQVREAARAACAKMIRK